MIMKSILRNTKFLRNQVPISLNLMSSAAVRGFAIKRYHFDDADYEPTVTQVSFEYSVIFSKDFNENTRLQR